MIEPLGKVGFIGLGLMGLPMAQNLVDAGVDLAVFNRTAAKSEPLVAKGATASDDVGQLAQQTRGGIVVICVSDTPAMTQTIEALTRQDLSGTLVIDMGTTTVDATRAAAVRVGAAGGAFMDAPVSGGALGATDGTLSIMAGGEATDIIRAALLFSVLGNSTTHIGPVGAGQIAKAANQAIVGATLGIVGETMLLAKTAGADPAKMREALLGGFAGSRILDLHGQRMIDRTFEPGGRARTQAKDLVQAADLAKSLNLNLPILAQCRDLWLDMVDSGMADLDQSGYLAFVESKQAQ
ncbi:dehydrogenase [Phaeobacter inhibens]|uniref:NAD(P)-dependent oxidoreductase n=1 Tax=Phaeobacter inhibens TaxID=221822 RepID=UPI00275E6C59|nr:NAD(P)-dependent oxidoreductase [Phaeobacter inhibens]GLO72785.1 dehydrogenase [Phaeobacter inhibens]